MKKLILPLALFLSVMSVLLLTSNFQQSSTYFYGITDNQEQSVSFQNAVVITDVKVIEGQIVEKGSILLTAKRSELNVEQDEYNSQLDEINARQNEAKAKLNAEINVLRAKKSAELFQIDAQIKQLKSKRQLNHELFKSITGNVPVTADANSNGLQQQIQSLNAQHKAVARSIQAQINSLNTQIKASEQPAVVQKNQIKKRLNEVNRQAEELTIRADFSGRIGSISFKPGEKIPSFQSIMTVHGLYPKTVKGYILESVANDVYIGQELWISSSNGHSAGIIKGEVESLGNRIVEYPERLKKNHNIKSWGREVNLSLPINNTLLLGEKVQISFTPQTSNSLTSFLAPLKEKGKALLPKSIAHQMDDR
ncbi:MAG: hypothetical protein V3V19_07610 [Cocleimonas sp.]